MKYTFFFGLPCGLEFVSTGGGKSGIGSLRLMNRS